MGEEGWKGFNFLAKFRPGGFRGFEYRVSVSMRVMVLWLGLGIEDWQRQKQRQ